MSTKTFILLLFGVLAFGGGLGGSFVAGLVVGNGQEAEAAVLPSLSTLSSAATEPSSSPGTGGIDPGDLRQMAQSGELGQEELTTLREQFQSRFGRGGAGPGQFAGSSGFGSRGPTLMGTVTAVEGNVLTLNTAQGDLQVSVGEDVTIRQTVVIAIGDLADGTRITVVGQRGDDGIIAANTIQVIPEGMDFTVGGGFGGRGGFGSFGWGVHGEADVGANGGPNGD